MKITLFRSVFFKLFGDEVEGFEYGVSRPSDGDNALGHRAVRNVDLGARLFPNAVDDFATFSNNGSHFFSAHNHTDGKGHVGDVIGQRLVNVGHD